MNLKINQLNIELDEALIQQNKIENKIKNIKEAIKIEIETIEKKELSIYLKNNDINLNDIIKSTHETLTMKCFLKQNNMYIHSFNSKTNENQLGIYLYLGNDLPEKENEAHKVLIQKYHTLIPEIFKNMSENIDQEKRLYIDGLCENKEDKALRYKFLVSKNGVYSIVGKENINYQKFMEKTMSFNDKKYFENIDELINDYIQYCLKLDQ